MNRFNYIGPAAQAISTFSAITSISEGNRMQAKAQEQQKAFTTDKVVIREASEVNKATKGDISGHEYAQKNKDEIARNIDSYAKRYGASNAEAGYKLNEGIRSEQGINTKANAIRGAQESMDNYKAKSRDPQLVYNTFKDTSYPDLSTIRNKEQEV